PPPAPVTAAILPSSIPAITSSSVAVRSNDEGPGWSTRLPVDSREGANGAGLPAATRGTLPRYLHSKRGNRPMPDTPTFGRYTEIPYDKMTLEQQEGYRSLLEARGRLPGPNKIYVHNPKLVKVMGPLGAYFRTGYSLSEREREIAVVIINSKFHSAYPTNAH